MTSPLTCLIGNPATLLTSGADPARNVDSLKDTLPVRYRGLLCPQAFLSFVTFRSV